MTVPWPNPFHQMQPAGPGAPQWPARQGWECPRCGTIHSPDVRTCLLCSPAVPISGFPTATTNGDPS